MKAKTAKQLQYMIAILLSAVMLIGLIPIVAFAAEHDNEIGTRMMLTVSSESGMPGETVKMTISLSNNPGIASLVFDVEYDSALTLAEVELNEDLFGMITAPEPFTNPETITMVSPLSDNTANGVLVTLTFSIDEDTPDGYVADVKIAYKSENIFSGEGEEIALDTVNGRINVFQGIPGDINGDKSVNTKDAIALFRYVAGWNIDVDHDALDVNGDSAVNTKDAIALFRYVAGWEGITLHRGSVNHTHSLVFTDEKSATCTEGGNIAYWYCTKCRKYFGDESGKTEFTLKDIEIPAKEHAVVIDPALQPTYTETGLTEGSHCSVCNTVIVKQQVVPVLETSYYSISYSNLQGAAAPSLNRYASHVGVSDVDMPKPEREGYKFIGWYTAINSGTQISDIPKGSTTNYHLYARWEIINYSITYKGAPKNNNPSTYTINDRLVLTKPEWNGLSFSHWTDENGNVLEKIEQGTIGNLQLTAHWRYAKNLAVPNKSNDFSVVYDNKNEQYYFIYELGSINNVVLNNHFSEKVHGINAFSYTRTETVKVEESIATNVAQTILQSITKTNDWSRTTELIEHNSETTKSEFTLCPEIGIGDVKAKIFEGSYGEISVDETTLSEIEYQHEYNGKEDGTSTTISSFFSYVKDTSTSVTYNVSLDPSYSPKGLYNYAYVGDVGVYAVVTYNPNTQNYYMDTYSVLYRTSTTVLYELLPEYNLDINIESNEPLSFDIPFENMKAYVESSYYVQYDANGGDGEMPLSTLACDKEQKLPANKFVRLGYAFSGWKVNGKGETIANVASVNNLADRGKTVTLSAVWTPIPYTVKWNSASHCTIEVERTTSPNVGAAKGRLNSGSTVYYGDVLNVTYTYDAGYTITKHGASSIVVTGNITASQIYAIAEANMYTIIYDPNGGSGSMLSSQHIYDHTKSLLNNEFTRHGWRFIGWNTKSDGSGTSYSNRQAVENLTSLNGETITLYATWELITTYDCKYNNFEVNNAIGGSQGYYFTLTDIFDMEALKSQGYTLHASMNFTLKDIDAGSDGKYRFGFRMYNGTGDTSPKLYDTGISDISTGYHTKSYNSIVNISCTSLSNYHIGFLFVEETYTVFGVITNRYNVEGLVMTIYFTK